MNHDDDLREFFAALRARDEREAPPPFPRLPVRKSPVRLLLWPLAAAAAVALLLLVWWPAAVPSGPLATDDVLTLTIEAGETTQTETLLSTPVTIDSWESPSSWLIADF